MEATRAVGNAFKDEVKRSKGVLPPQEVKPLDADEFRESCRYLGEDILGPKHLTRLVRWLSLNRNKLKQIFPAGGKCCLAVMPTSDMGIPLSPAEAKQHRYFYPLFVSGEDGLTYEFSFTPGHFFELLPRAIQEECSFDVHYGDNNTFVSDGDFKAFQQAFVKAFHNLRKFFGLEPIQKE